MNSGLQTQTAEATLTRYLPYFIIVPLLHATTDPSRFPRGADIPARGLQQQRAGRRDSEMNNRGEVLLSLL